MLHIPTRVMDAMLDHCRHDHPIEACGVLAGPIGGQPDEVIRMDNPLRSRTRYAMDECEQLTVWQQLADAGRAPLVIYHSHTATPATLSAVDVACAAQPGAHYLVVSTRNPTPEVRAWALSSVADILAEVTIAVTPN